jgi:hypothetical protein
VIQPKKRTKRIEAVSAANSLSVDAKATAIIIFTLFLVAILVPSAECKHTLSSLPLKTRKKMITHDLIRGCMYVSRSALAGEGW